ncbi:adrenocorticotropic hormone receptor-like [Montipora capricornis]|uniref:adrenocorticotropic hormone receptor-like n=1 Tax=Montipora foliosa TaxID=591990 RepID=UPI0035F1324A
MAGVETSCASVRAPVPLSFITASLSVLLALMTIPGNFLVCFAVFKDPYKSLKTPFTFFVVNLAVSDLIVGVMTEPISVLIHFREGLSLDIGHQFVWLIHMSYFISCTASVLNLAALTADRYTAISYPLRYRARFGIKRAIFITGSIWFFSCSLPFVYFKVGYLRYTFVFANTAVALTLIIFLFTYARVLRGMRAHVSELKTIRQSSQSEENRARLRAASSDKKLTQVLMMMLGIFLFCYTPSCVMIYIMNLCLSCDCITIHVLRDLQFIFVLLSSALNPFLYAWRLPNFRRAFKRILLPRSIQDESLPSSMQDYRGKSALRTVELVSYSARSRPDLP